MFRKLKRLLAARRKFREDIENAAVHADLGLSASPPPYESSKTYKKSIRAGKGTGIAVVATGGPIAAVLILVRMYKPEMLPWGAKEDAVIVAALTVIAGPIVAFIRQWKKDTVAHGGN